MLTIIAMVSAHHNIHMDVKAVQSWGGLDKKSDLLLIRSLFGLIKTLKAFNAPCHCLDGDGLCRLLMLKTGIAIVSPTGPNRYLGLISTQAAPFYSLHAACKRTRLYMAAGECLGTIFLGAFGLFLQAVCMESLSGCSMLLKGGLTRATML